MGALDRLSEAGKRRGANAIERTLRGIEASFSKPLAALRFGVFARDDMKDVQVGIHFGRPLASRTGQVARGPAARAVRRLASVARPGQLLMTGEFFERLGSSGSTAFDSSCREIGEYRLQPGGAHYRIFVLGDGDRPAAEIPPLGETNIDETDGAFFGREQTIAQLFERTERHSVVTVTGGAGTGKSTLAAEFARRVRTRQPEIDVWVVDVTPCETLEDFVSSLGAEIGVQFGSQSGGELLMTLGQAIDARGECLIVLDGAEEIAREVAVSLQTLLPMASGPRWLVTSRRPLNLVPEYELEIGGLTAGDAALLFCHRLDRPGRPFRLSEAALESVLEIAHAIRGIPHAVKAAADMAVSRPLTEVVDQLDRLFDDERDDDLRDERVVDIVTGHLLEQLDEHLRDALETCAATPSAFPLEIARTLLAESTSADAVGDILDALRQRGLIELHSPEGHEDELAVVVPRATADVLANRADRDDAIDAWLEAFGEWVSTLLDETRELVPTAQVFERLDRQRDLLLFAARTALDREHARAPGLVLAVHRLIEARGPVFVARSLIDGAISLEDSRGASDELHRLLIARAKLKIRGSDFEGAAADASRVADALKSSTAPDVKARALTILSRSHFQGDRDAKVSAAETIDRARNVAGRSSSLRTEAYVLAEAARQALQEGSPALASGHVERALNLLRRDSDPSLDAELHSLAGIAAAEQFRFEQGREHLSEAVAIRRELGMERKTIPTLHRLGDVEAALGREETASRHYWKSVSIARRTGANAQVGRSYVKLGIHRCHQLEFEQARTFLQEATGKLEETADAVLRGRARAWLGAAEAALGRLDPAEAQLSRARGHLADLQGDPWELALDLLEKITDIAAVEHGMAEPSALRPPQRTFVEAVTRARRDRAVLEVARPVERYLVHVESGGGRDSGDATRPTRPTLLADPHAEWLQLPGRDRADLSRRDAPRLIFARLLRHRHHFPGVPLPIEILGDVGWPDEELSTQTIKSRVYGAVSALRELGLRDILVTDHGGYHLSPEYAIRHPES